MRKFKFHEADSSFVLQEDRGFREVEVLSFDGAYMISQGGTTLRFSKQQAGVLAVALQKITRGTRDEE